MSGIISNILRSGMMLLGAWLAGKGVDPAIADAGTEAILNIITVVIAGAGAIWSLVRSVSRAKRGVE